MGTNSRHQGRLVISVKEDERVWIGEGMSVWVQRGTSKAWPYRLVFQGDEDIQILRDHLKNDFQKGNI